MKHRQHLLEVIELWIENYFLSESLPSTIAPTYLTVMEPETLRRLFTDVTGAVVVAGTDSPGELDT